MPLLTQIRAKTDEKCFLLKAFLVLNILTFLVRLFGPVEKWLHKKVKINFKICDVTRNCYILPNISRSKGNQAIKFGQIKNITRNIFFEKSYTKNGVEKLLRDSFLFRLF